MNSVWEDAFKPNEEQLSFFAEAKNHYYDRH